VEKKKECSHKLANAPVLDILNILLCKCLTQNQTSYWQTGNIIPYTVW